MTRKTFTDVDGNKGTIGSIVRPWMGYHNADKSRTVKHISSKGAGGTRLDFEEGGYNIASNVKIVDKPS